jgi:hypothetical protein
MFNTEQFLFSVSFASAGDFDGTLSVDVGQAIPGPSTVWLVSLSVFVLGVACWTEKKATRDPRRAPSADKTHLNNKELVLFHNAKRTLYY